MMDQSDAGHIENVSALFGEIVRYLQLLHGGEWIDVDLSMAQFKALMLITTTGGLPGRELAHRLGVGPSAVTPIVDKLVQHGYVWRQEDASDRRICWARPTQAGASFFERVNAAGRDRLETVLTSLAQEDLALLEDALNALRNAAAACIANLKEEKTTKK